VLREELLIVTPQEHDIVRVIGGSDNVGLEGELVCIDGTDAIVKEHNENFRIVDFIQLAKVRLL
jgi:transcription elongation factor SPT5